MQPWETEVAQLQADLAARGARWTARVTSMSSVPIEALHRYTGYRPGPGDPAVADLERLGTEAHARWLVERAASVSSTPPSADWTSFNGHNFVTSVKDQGSCGSCAGFSMAAAAEVTARVQINLPCDVPNSGMFPDLSPADLLFCSGGNCDSGNSPSNCGNYIKNTGVVPWSVFSPSGKNQSCPTPSPALTAQRTQASLSYGLGGGTTIRQFLAQTGAMAAPITMYPNFRHYGGGVFEPSGTPEPYGHGLCVVGYDDDLGAWHCKNSWGTDWGENGFCWIAYGTCGIDAMMWTVAKFRRIYLVPVLSFGGPDEYDSGISPCVATSDSEAVEVHKAGGNNGMWYHEASAYSTFDDSHEYDTGWHPYVGINGNGQIVETHKAASESKLHYRLGQAGNGTVDWGDSHEYDDGLYSAVAINDVGTIVEVHQSQVEEELWCRVGQRNDDGTISWGGGAPFKTGIFPSIALNNWNDVIEIHQSQGDATLWGYVGKVDPVAKTISWGDGQPVDAGYYPDVTLNDSRQIVQVHQSNTDTTLWARVGWLLPDLLTAVWSTAMPYDQGLVPRISLSQGGLVREAHQSNSEEKLWSRMGTLTPGVIAPPATSDAADTLAAED